MNSYQDLDEKGNLVFDRSFPDKFRKNLNELFP